MDLTDEAKAEIKEAIRILKEDGVHIHKTYAAFQKSQEETKSSEETTTTEGGPPPLKETKTEPPVKQGLWWKGRTSD